MDVLTLLDGGAQPLRELVLQRHRIRRQIGLAPSLHGRIVRLSYRSVDHVLVMSLLRAGSQAKEGREMGQSGFSRGHRDAPMSPSIIDVKKLSRAELAGRIDATLLRPEATDDDVTRLCRVASSLGAATVCVSPARLPLRPGALAPGIGCAAVVGFPSGAHRRAVKVAEARQAVEDGATELDMVLDLGALCDRAWVDVRAEVAAVRAAVPAAVLLKVILESGLLEDADLVRACEEVERAGADYVKTSTGFHPAGGHTLHAVEVMAAAVGGRLGVKASGGVRSTDQAIAVLRSGATRIGASDVAAVLAGLPTESQVLG